MPGRISGENWKATSRAALRSPRKTTRDSRRPAVGRRFWRRCGSCGRTWISWPGSAGNDLKQMALGCGRGLLSCLAAAKTASLAPPIHDSRSTSRIAEPVAVGWVRVPKRDVSRLGALVSPRVDYRNYYARPGRLGQVCYDQTNCNNPALLLRQQRDGS
jgi:hypothetical protein